MCMETPEQLMKEAPVVAVDDMGYADVWHQGTRSYYYAKLLRKLTPEEAEFDPTECSQENTNLHYVPSRAQLGTEHGVKSPYAQP